VGDVISLIEYKVHKNAKLIEEQQALDNYIRALTCSECGGETFLLIADTNNVVCNNCNMKVQVQYATTHITEEENNE